MLRFILVKCESDCDLNYKPREHYFTQDIECPELESILRKGRKSRYAYEYYELRGVEIKEPKDDR